VRLPSAQEADEALARLGVADADRQELLAAGPPTQDPELARLLQRCHRELVAGIGGLGMIEGWPAIPDEKGALGRYFYVWVLLSAIPALREFHASKGIPEEATVATLSELGSQMANRRAIFGVGGLATYRWMTVHFRGSLFRVGRLLYERQRIWFDSVHGGHVANTTSPRKGAWALGIHIPRGRLTPEACDASIAAAETFFARHFPDEPYAFATCVSWVLDDQLTNHLATDSNIVRFQRRFHVEPSIPNQDGHSVDDKETVEAVFRQPWPGIENVDELPQTTSLERGIVAHLRAGGHWHYRTGWFGWRSGS
jgi:hypothetical protein